MSPTKTVLDHDLSGDAAHNIQDLTAGRGWPTGAADALRRQDLADHVDGSTITWDAGTGKMSSAGGGSTGIASWDITKCRYIFVDPINGSDANGGYIDAAPGSTFTALQVLAVSVKTTHRINEIRPIVGAGRMCVVLIGANGNQTAQGIISVAPPSFYTDGDSIVMPTGVGTATIDMRFQVTSGYSPIPGTITLDLRPFLVGNDYNDTMALVNNALATYAPGLSQWQGGSGHQFLAWPVPGSAGNQPISVTCVNPAALGCVGFSGGTDGSTVLDHATVGDGLGMEDRHQRFGYSKLYTRGSDLTNSAADQSQMGFATAAAYAGGGATGEWTVGTVATTTYSDGTTIQLVGATFPAGIDMARYRLRALHGATTFYIPIRWSAIDSNATDKLVAWIVPGTLSPGDSIWVEEPGVILDSFQEASSYAEEETLNAAFLAGFKIATSAAFGCPDDPDRPTSVTGVVVSGTATGTGYLIGRQDFYSESGVTAAALQFGLVAQYLGFQGRHCEAVYSVIAGGNPSYIDADFIDIEQSSLESCLFVGGSDFMRVGTCNTGQLTLSPTSFASLGVIRPFTAWSPGIVVSPTGGGVFISFGGMHNLRLVAEGGEPNSPAITLKAGQYAVLFDHGSGGATPVPGNGVRIEYDVGSTKFTPLTWGSLKTTGFEIEGLQKVLCKLTGANYHEDMLPCPRGKVMQLLDHTPS